MRSALTTALAAFAVLAALTVSAQTTTGGINLQVQVVGTSTTSTPPGGGGGGGGGGSVITATTSISLYGYAYPLSQVNVLRDGRLVVSTIAGPDARFSVTLSGLRSGSHNISVYTQDVNGNRSALFGFPVVVTSGVTTAVSGIYLSPAIDVGKVQVRQGDIIPIFGRTTPSSTVTITVNSSHQVRLTAQSDASGVYLYNFDTDPLEYGNHSALSRANIGNTYSADSERVGFVVGNQNILKTPSSTTPGTCIRADLNCDGRVNLVDFSILAYWYRRPSPPARVDLNGDRAVNLADFSIMAYYWTG